MKVVAFEIEEWEREAFGRLLPEHEVRFTSERTGFQERRQLRTLLADHVLLRLRNVIVTPHGAFNTKEAAQRILDTSAENIAAFVRGVPQNLVTRG